MGQISIYVYSVAASCPFVLCVMVDMWNIPGCATLCTHTHTEWETFRETRTCAAKRKHLLLLENLCFPPFYLRASYEWTFNTQYIYSARRVEHASTLEVSLKCIHKYKCMNVYSMYTPTWWSCIWVQPFVLNTIYFPPHHAALSIVADSGDSRLHWRGICGANLYMFLAPCLYIPYSNLFGWHSCALPS